MVDGSAHQDIGLNNVQVSSTHSQGASFANDDDFGLNLSDEPSVTPYVKKKSKDKFKEEDYVAVGNFSLLNSELMDFIDNRNYNITILDDNEVRKVFDPEKSQKVQTFYLTRDYVYDDATDKEFIHGITLLKSPNKNTFHNIIINGNGHFIDGAGLANIFRVGGSNIQICNLTFRNMSSIHDYYLNEIFGNKYPSNTLSDNAPIVWTGIDGSLFNCTFTDNIGYSGGSILWRGNNGYIGHNKFVNNFARYLGGFAYVEGKNVTITDNLVANCEARLDGDALYVKDLSSCIVENMNFIKLNLTNSSFVAPDIVDGSLMDVDIDILRATYLRFANTLIDTFPIAYGTLFYGYDFYNLSDDIVAFTSYDDSENLLTLTLSRYVSPSLEIRKMLNIEIDKNDFSSSFMNLVFEDASFQLINHYTVNNAVYYSNAVGLEASVVKSMYNQFKNEMGYNDTERLMVMLDVKFDHAMSISSDLTWTPNGFDVINIDGNGCLISITNHERDEKKFVDWSGDAIFVASNLRVSGFNNAFMNDQGR